MSKKGECGYTEEHKCHQLKSLLDGEDSILREEILRKIPGPPGSKH